MASLASIFAFLKMLPGVFELLKEVWGYYKANYTDTPEKFLVDATAVFQRLNSAKTPDEKRKRAKEIQDLIRRL